MDLSDLKNTDNKIEVVCRFEDGKPKKKSRWKRWGLIALGLILLSSFIRGFFSQPEPYDLALPLDDFTALIKVEGVIAEGASDFLGRPEGYQHKFTLEKIDQLIETDNNEALIVYVDSPGGGVYESDELYLKIKEYQEKTDRPVLSYMASMAASGGYYISAPADRIVANRNTWTGSIGVALGTQFDLTGLLDKHGIETKTLTSGTNKAMGNLWDPMNEDQEAIFQSMIDEAYDQFVEIIVEGRGLSDKKVRDLADGRIYTAKQALELDMIDDIASYEEAEKSFLDDYNLLPNVHKIDFYDDSLMGKFLGALANLRPSNEVDSLLGLIRANKNLGALYIYPGYYDF